MARKAHNRRKAKSRTSPLIKNISLIMSVVGIAVAIVSSYLMYQSNSIETAQAGASLKISDPLDSYFSLVGEDYIVCPPSLRIENSGGADGAISQIDIQINYGPTQNNIKLNTVRETYLFMQEYVPVIPTGIKIIDFYLLDGTNRTQLMDYPSTQETIPF